MTGHPRVIPYARAIARLLQGVVYNDDPYWKDILQNQVSITQYLEKIGIEVIVDQADGYAYIQQPLKERGINHI